MLFVLIHTLYYFIYYVCGIKNIYTVTIFTGSEYEFMKIYLINHENTTLTFCLWNHVY